MKVVYIILTVLLLTACQDDAPVDVESGDAPAQEHIEEEIEDDVEISETVEETNNFDAASFVYEVDPMMYPLQGTINGDTIYMQLDFHAHKIEGKYMYKKYKKPIKLEGYYTLKGFILNEFTNEGTLSAYFLAEGNYRNFTGKWYKSGKLNNGSVKLSLIDSYGVYLEPTDKFTALGNEESSEYAIEKGLDLNCPDCISFRSMTKPSQHLRHQGFQIKQHGYTNCKDQLFRKDASFRMLPGLVSDTAVSFQSFNYPNHYIYYNTETNRFAMKEKSMMTPEEKVKASFVLEKHKVETGGLDFTMTTQVDGGLEIRPFVTGRIMKDAFKFEFFDVGDGAPIYGFVDQNGEGFYFSGSLDEHIELGVLVPDGEANAINQGYIANENHVGAWFEVEYSEQYTFTSFNMSEYEDIKVIRSLKKL